MAIVGSASVTINADVRDLANQVEAQLKRLDRTGKSVGQNIGRNIREGINAGIGDIDPAGNISLTQVGKRGQRAGEVFGKDFLASATSEIRSLPSKIDGQKLGKDIASGVNTGFASNLGVADSLYAEMDLASQHATRAGDEGRRNFEAGFKGKPMNLGIDYDADARKRGRSAGMTFSKAFDEWSKSRKAAPFEDMIAGLAENAVQLQVTQGLMAGAIGYASSLVTALINLGAAAYYAAPALLKFGNVLSALGQGMIVAKLAFKGVGDAIGALIKKQDAAQKATKSQARSALDEAERLLRIKQARDALNDAIIEGARSNQDAIERVSDAEEALRDAIEGVADAQESLSDAIEGVSDAEEGVRDAIDDEAKAQRAVADARDKARERLEDLQLALDRASLNEERAALNLKKAEKKLAEARAGGNVNAIYEADLAYREQLQSMRELQEGNGDLRDEADQAFREGVNGNQDVIDAQEGYRDAVEATSDAQEALRDALEGVADAQEGVSDAVERQSDAQRDLKRAIEDVPRAAVDAALRIEAAQLALKRALEKPIDSAVESATEAAEAALAKLTPAAQEFVRYWMGTVIPTFKAIQQAGQEEFFKGLNKAMRTIMGSTELIRILRETFVNTSKTLGELAKDFAKAFTAPDTLKALEAILDSNVVIIENLGKAASALARPLMQIFATTAPFAEEWSKGIADAAKRFSDFIDSANRSGDLQAFFKTSNALLGKFWDILKNLGSGFAGIFKAALPAGTALLNAIENMTSVWSDRMNNPANQDALKSTFQSATDNAVLLLKILGAVGGVLFRMGANPAFKKLGQTILDVIPTFEQLASDAMNQVLPAIDRIIAVLPEFGKFFTETGTVKTFMDIVATMVEKVAGFLGWLADNPFGKKLIQGVGPLIGAFLAFKLVVGLTAKAFKPFQTTYKNMKNIKKATDDIGKSMTKTKRSAQDAVTRFKDFIKTRKAMKGAEKEVTGGGTGKGSYWSKKGASGSVAGMENAAQDAREQAKARAKISQAVEKEAREEARRAADRNKQMAADLKKVGANAGESVEDAIRRQIPGIENMSKEMAERMVRAVKDELGIKSPSLVFRRIGEDTVEGLVQGINASIPESRAAIERASSVPAGAAAQARVEGAKVGEAFAEGQQSSLTANIPEVRKAMDDLNDSGAGALAEARADGTRLGEAKGEALESSLRANIPEVRKASAELNAAAGGKAGKAAPVAAKAAAGKAAGTAPVAAAAGSASKVGKVGKAFGAMGSAIGGAGRAIAGFVGPMLVMTLVMNVLLPILQKVWNENENLRNAVNGLLEVFSGLLTTVVDALAPFLSTVIDVFTNLVKAIAPTLADIGKIFGNLISAVAPFIGQLVGVLGNLVGMIVTTLGPVIESLIPVFMGLVETLAAQLVPIFQEMVPMFMELVSTLVAQLMPVIQDLIAALVPFIMQWVQMAATLWAQIMPVLMQLVMTLVQALLPAIVSLVPVVMELVGTFVSQLLPVVMQLIPPIMELTMSLMSALLPVILMLLPPIVKLAGFLLTVAVNIIKFLLPILVKIITFILKVVIKAFTLWLTVVTNVIGGLISGVKSAWKKIGTLWETYGKPALDKVKSAFTGVKNFIKGIVRGIGTIWGKIVDKVKSPVRTVVNGINDWLIGPLNKVLSKFGVDTIKKISVDWTNKATGGPVERGKGYIRGPGGPTDDRIPTMLSNGEYVIRSKSVSRIGRQALDHLNRTGDLPRGGAWDWISEKGKNLWDKTVGNIDDLLMKGVGYALSKIIGFGVDMAKPLRGTTVTDMMYGMLVNMQEGVKKWGEKKDREAEAANKPGAPVPPYTGPAGGWTYPLAKRFAGNNYEGHNPPWAFDIHATSGTPVRAVSAGRVITVRNKGKKSYGRYIEIIHADSKTSLYAHLSKQGVAIGQMVKTGDVIGLSGNTGHSTGPHLHFELKPGRSTKALMRKRGVRLATGGTVRATPGGLAAILAEGGRDERVTPLDSQGRSATEVEMLEVLKGMSAKMGGNTFQIFPAPGMSERDLAVKTSREVAYLHRRRS